MYSLPLDEIKVENIQHIHVNGVASTVFDVYRKHYNKFDQEVWAYAGTETLKGTIKRASTIAKRITK